MPTLIPRARLSSADAFSIGFDYVMRDIADGVSAEASFDLLTTPAHTERTRACIDGGLAAKALATKYTTIEDGAALRDQALRLAAAHGAELPATAIAKFRPFGATLGGK